MREGKKRGKKRVFCLKKKKKKKGWGGKAPFFHPISACAFTFTLLMIHSTVTRSRHRLKSSLRYLPYSSSESSVL